MSGLFDEEVEIFTTDPEEIHLEIRPKSALNARRQLEDLLDEKRLKAELEDFLD